MVCGREPMKVIYPLDDEDERDSVVHFVQRFNSLPIRGTDQATSEFFALVRDALITGQIDSRLRVIASPRLGGLRR